MKARFRFLTLARSFTDFDPETRRSAVVFQSAGVVELDLTGEVRK